MSWQKILLSYFNVFLYFGLLTLQLPNVNLIHRLNLRSANNIIDVTKLMKGSPLNLANGFAPPSQNYFDVLWVVSGVVCFCEKKNFFANLYLHGGNQS